MFASGEVAITGTLKEFTYRSSKNSEVKKASCAICSSPIYGMNTRTPDYLTFTVGTMDSADDLHVEVVIFERDKQHWDHLREHVTSFATQPDWTPDSQI